MTKGRAATARAVALVGPYGSGKTELLEALLVASGAKEKMGTAASGDRLGDSTPEARSRGMTTEINVASFEYLEDTYHVLDCPGSIEFGADAAFALPAADIAVVVAEADPQKVAAVQPTLQELHRLGVPHILFLNKIDEAGGRVRDLQSALEDISPRPLVLRQIPIWDGEAISGFIDLASERAYVYRSGKESQRVDIPSDLADREADARFQMLEKLADFDDTLMEALLEDAKPELNTVFKDLTEELQQGLITPVLIGSASSGGGVRRLLKALRHETPDASVAAERLLGAAPGDTPTAYIFKTSHAGQAGKLSLARVLGGKLSDGATYTRADGSTVRGSGLMAVEGGDHKKTDRGEAGDVVGIGRLDDVLTGEIVVIESKGVKPAMTIEAPPAVYGLAVTAGDRKDEVKITASMTKLVEEDPALSFGPDADTGEFVLRGLGDVHLKNAVAKLERKFGVTVQTRTPATPYRETIRKRTTQRGRHKKQSGGHGQFGDVVLEVRPLERGAGFAFEHKISGGVVPKQYFPAVESGVKDACQKGPLGFPVIDAAATLVDGSHHSVDSSEIAFRTAGRIGMQTALAECSPVLLEPIWKVEIVTPSEMVSKVTAILTGKRGQILGFNPREGWSGWDRVEGYLPQVELNDLIIDLRSATQGSASFTAEFDHMAELTGRLAEQVREGAEAALAD